MSIPSALMCSLLVSAVGREQPPELFLLAVGNDIGFASEEPLRYAERDASRIAAILQRLGGVPPQNTVVMLGEKAHRVRRVLLDLNARLRRSGGRRGRRRTPRQAVLLVYYSGHADAERLHLGTTTFAFDELKSIIDGSAAAIRILIVDACRSGGVTRVKGAAAAQEFDIRLYNRISAEGVAIMTSSAAGENSYESDQLRASFFSHHLANALRGAADSNGDTRVTLSEAYRYTYQQTLRSTGRTVNPQHPTYQYQIRGKGGLVLTTLRHDRLRSGYMRMPDQGLYLVMERDEAGPIAAEVAVDKGGARLALPAGRYLVQKRASNYYLEYQVHLEAGREVDLSQLDHRKLQYAQLLRKGGGKSRAIYGVHVLGGLRGEVLDDYGPSSQLTAAASVDLAWLSLGLRAHFTQKTTPTDDQAVEATHAEWGLGLTVQRFVDVAWFSASAGLMVEAVYHRQSFTTPGVAHTRSSLGLALGALLSAEVRVLEQMALVVEGGPVTHVFRQATTDAGAQAGSSIVSPLTGWVGAGLAWRFH